MFKLTNGEDLIQDNSIRPPVISKIDHSQV